MDPGAGPGRRRGWLVPVVLLACGGLFGPGPLAAQSGSEGTLTQEGASFVLLPTGGRGVALGGAVSALVSSEAAWWNPAGLARVEERTFLLTRGEHITGEALALNLHQGGRRGGIGVAYQLLDEGTLDLTDAEGNVLGSFTNRNHTGLLTAALPLGSRLDLGMNVKYLRFEIGCRGQCPEGQVLASTWALDLGGRFRPLSAFPLDLGASLRHLGPGLRNRASGTRESLPARYRLGAAWEPWTADIEGERLSLVLLLDMEDRIRDPGSPALLLGAEFSAGSADQIFVRGGYALIRQSGLEGGGAGFGIRYDRFELALARALTRGAIQSQQEPVHLTLAVRF